MIEHEYTSSRDRYRPRERERNVGEGRGVERDKVQTIKTQASTIVYLAIGMNKICNKSHIVSISI